MHDQLELEGQGDERRHLGCEGDHRGHDRQGEDADAQQVQRHQRPGQWQLAAHQHDPGDDAEGELEGSGQARAGAGQDVDAGDHQTEGEGVQPRAQQVETFLDQRVLRQGARRHQEGGDAEGHVDGEQPLPGGDREDRRGQGWTGGGGGGDHQGVQPDAAPQHPLRIGVADQGAVDAHDPRSAEPLQGAGGGEHEQRGGKCAAQRGQGEDQQSRLVDSPIADDLAQRRQRQQ